MNYLKKYETFTIGDLDKYDKNDLDELLSNYETIHTFVNPDDIDISDIKKEIEKSINHFKKEFPIFEKIHVQLIHSDEDDTLGYYVNESCLHITTIFLVYENIMDNISDEYSLELIIRTTLFHELGHAIVDLDRLYELYVLYFDDEEEYVENFAYDFDVYGEIPEEMFDLLEKYKEM